jgi:hypothetical protein
MMEGAITYNLFRQGLDPAILCAVANDEPVPAFIKGPSWCFERAIPIGEAPRDSFRPKLATTAASFNGFYLFLALGRAFHEPWQPMPNSPRPLLSERLAA